MRRLNEIWAWCIQRLPWCDSIDTWLMRRWKGFGRWRARMDSLALRDEVDLFMEERRRGSF
jgi:hypothetical protein